jgi:virginiamycin B lyase
MTSFLRGVLRGNRCPEGGLRFSLVLPLVALVAVATGAQSGGATSRSATVSASGVTSPVGTVAVYTDYRVRDYGEMTAGPDGAIWFTNGNTIGRITVDGTVSLFIDPRIDAIYGITAGPDGALWFVNYGSIGRITTGGTVSTYSDPRITDPRGITVGSDGALWFANYGSIGRITTAGAVTIYSDPRIGGANAIAAGADGALWFTNWSSSIGRITTGGDLTIFSDPSIGRSVGIAAGSDGALWFTHDGSNTVGRITTSGVITSYSLPCDSFPCAPLYPVGIGAGPDGALWLTTYYNCCEVGRLTTSGSFTEFVRATVPRLTPAIAPGPDGGVWFRSAQTGFPGIYRMQAVGDVTPPTITVPAALVVDATSAAGAEVVYTATATDNTDPSPLLTCAPASGTVLAIGDTTVSCTARDASGNSATGSFAVHVNAPAPTSKDQCKNGGWHAFGVFKNQGDCVSYAATGGKNKPKKG